MNIPEILLWGLRLAGVGQFFVAGIYFWVRGILGWHADLEKLRPHNRAIAHTYSRYIQVINTVFGLICLFQTRELLNGTILAADLTLMMGCYWLMRLILQFIYYDVREITAQRRLYYYGVYAFDLLFVLQTAPLLAAFAYNLHALTGGHHG